MLALWMRTSVAAAMLSGVAATSSVVQDQLDWARSKLAGSAADPAANAALSAAITEWRSLSATNNASFDRYATFLIAHPGWPNEAQMRRAAEAALTNGVGSPSTTVAYFRKFPPATSTGWVRFADALNATGATVEAGTAARIAWIRGSLSATDEARVISTWPGALSPADQDQRMDTLLWQGATQAAARQLALTSPARRPIFAARLAFRTRSPDAGTSTPPGAEYDAGYIADRAQWLSATGADGSARSLLAKPHDLQTRPGDVARWYGLMLRLARSAATAGDNRTAYDIARQVDDAYPQGTDISQQPYGERDAYTDLVWLAGQTALKKLGRPSDAIGMFVRYSNGSRSPALRTKGLYWAGRAAEAAGRRDEARE